MYMLLLLIGVLAGITALLFGFGGGFVIVPVLYSILLFTHDAHSAVGQAAMHIAVATSTCFMIFGASMAAWRHHRAGTIPWTQIRALMGYIACGAVLGALAAHVMSGAWVRWVFIAYLAATILDSLLRPGFMRAQARPARPLDRAGTAGAGLGIGVIAAMLGVGGSVMTVPLMRRRGASMTTATASANPLSLPVALAGTAAYVILGWNALPAAEVGYAGYVDLRACLALIAGSWLGIRLASRWVARFPDHLHARIYIALLSLVLAVMLYT